MMRAAAITTAIVLLASGCASSRNGSPGTVLVQFADQTDPSTAASIREKVNAQLVVTLPETKTEIWQVDSDRLADVAALRNDTHLRFIETGTQSAPPAIPAGTANIADLPDFQQQTIEGLTQRAAPDEYRITDSRPNGLSADLIGTQSRLSIPLLSGQAPVFMRDSVEKATDGAELIWMGHTVDGDGETMLVVKPGGATGRIQLGKELYLVLPFGDGRQLIRHVQAAGSL